MIVSTLKHSDRIESLHPLFKKVFDYVKSHDLLHTPMGKIVLHADALTSTATICSSTTPILLA